MRGSALTVLQKEARARIGVSVDIDVQRGRFAVLVQVVGRGGTIEREYDDTKFFTFNIRRQNRMRTLIRYMSEEIKTGVARLATEDFIGQIGNVVDGTLRFRTESGSWMMDIKGGAAGVIPPEEQLLTYNALPLKQGDELSCFVLDVDQNLFTGREQTPVVLSMTIPALVGAIIRQEVPQVASGEVEIKSIARIAGKVTKVAVALREGATTWTDAVALCLGEDQSFLRRIRERCGGEVVHFLPWSDDPVDLIKSALFPADVLRVEESFPDGTQKRKFTAYVKEVDLRRAIGAGGNNVKLCASLTNAFVVIEVDETAGNTRRRGSFNDDLDDSYDSGFWGDDREDDFFGGGDAENFANNLNNDRFSEQTKSVQLDDLGWPDLDVFDDLPTTNTADRGAQGIPSVRELKTLGETLKSSEGEDDELEEWDVGPGRPGLTTFGATGRPGVVGTALFYGDAAGEYDDDEVIFD
jgi:transcription antitermination factor NusA-like protein